MVCKRGLQCNKEDLERLDVSRLTLNMRCFDGFIRESELIDPSLRNVAFTWSNMQKAPIFAKTWKDFCSQMSEIIFSLQVSKERSLDGSQIIA